MFSPGCEHHRGPILTVANWSGQWPGLVGMLNLNGCLQKAGVTFSTLWSKDFKDEFFRSGLRQWLKSNTIEHDAATCMTWTCRLAGAERQLGAALARDLKTRKAILGVFDEGCMGMYNAIIEDYLLNPTGVYKERLSQSALVAAHGYRDRQAKRRQCATGWMARGLTFVTGTNEETDLTDGQILEQCKMYIAALRIADEFGCDAIGIQYQQG